MHVLESRKKLSESLLWRLQREFFERSGPEAWSRGIVPHYVTSNPFIAEAYAQVVFAWLNDCVEAGIDARQPLYLLEIAAGSGRFAFAFLRALFRRLDRSPLRELRVTYVMSDFAARNVEAARAHPRLAPFVERGALDFARFDGERDQEIQLLHSGQRLAPGHLRNPLGVIANYYFDGIPQDSFAVENGVLFENLLTLHTPEPESEVALERLSLQYQAEPAGAACYPEADLNRILARYQERLGNTSFAFPIAGLRCCRFLRRLSGDRLLLLSADKGVHHEASLLGRSPPAPALHGSFSMGVNYHAIGEYFRDAGGALLAAPHEGSAITVVAGLLGPSQQARHAFADAVEGFGPDDFFLLKKACERHFSDFSLPEILALLRLAGWDARIFDQCLPALFERIQGASADAQRELRRAIDEVWSRWFPIGEETDLARNLGLLLVQMGCLPEAIEYFRRSPAPEAAYHIACCRFHLRQLAEAEEELDRLLESRPAHGEARALRLEIRRQRPPREVRPTLKLLAV